ESKRVGEVSASGGSALRLCTMGAQGSHPAQGGIPKRSRKGIERARDRTLGDSLFQVLQEPNTGNRARDRDRRLDVGQRQIPWLLSRNDLRRFSRRRKPRQRKSRPTAE